VEPRVDLFIDGEWDDRTDDVTSPVTISRGNDSEQTGLTAGRCSLTFDNRDGKYSNRNPLSEYFGKIGRNTSLRVRVVPGWTAGPASDALDTFARTLTNTWGSPNVGPAWTPYGSGGSVLTTDWTVDGSVGHHSVPAPAAYRASWLADPAYAVADFDATVDFRVNIADVTGGSLEPCNITFRARDADVDTLPDAYYLMRILVDTAEQVSVRFMLEDGTVLGSADVSLLWTGQHCRARLQVFGSIMRVKVWDDATSEPDAWALTVQDSTYTEPGGFGVRNGVASGNTNAKPIVFDADNVALTVWLIRFVGEVSEWPPRWSSEADVRTPIEAAGIVRRLSQGAKTLDSLMKRTAVASATLGGDQIAAVYWPCEDGSDSTQAASALPGGQPLLFTGNVDFASSSDFPGSNPLPTLRSGGNFTAPVPATVDTTGSIFLRMALYIPTGHSIPNGQTLFNLYANGGNVTRFAIIYGTGGSLELRAINDHTGTTVDTTGPVGFALDGIRVLLYVELTQSGSDVDYIFGVYKLTADGRSVTGSLDFFSLTGVTAGRCVGFAGGGSGMMDGCVVGHIGIANAQAFLLHPLQALCAYAGETAADRALRLAPENGVSLHVDGNVPDLTPEMGWQKPAKLLDLLQQCADADQGLLCERRHEAGLRMVPLGELYNQTAVELDYAAGQVVSPLEPTDDDQLTRNYVIAQRIGGSSSPPVVQETGPLSVQAPPDGVGTYDRGPVDVNVNFDDQLVDVAGWALHLGTWDEARYPELSVDLMAPPIVNNPALLAALVDLDIGGQVAIANPPAWLPPDLIELLDVGYHETLDEAVWTATHNCLPAGPYRVAVEEVDQYESGGSELAAAVDEDDTVLDVAVGPVAERGRLWTVNDAEFPFNVTVGGEVWSVDDIAPPTSPTFQTGTVAHGNNTSVVPGLPVSILDGDVLFLLAAIRNLGTGVPNTPDGYTRLPVFDVADNVQLFAKKSSGAESAPTVSFTGGVAGADTSARIVRFRGLKVHDVSNVVHRVNVLLNASAQDITYPPLGDIRIDNCLVLVIGWKQDDWTSVAQLAGASEVFDDSTATGNDQGIVMDRIVQTAAAPIAGGSFTVTGGAAAISRAAVVALHDDAQTWTVQRSQNGIAKAHDAGAAVELDTPPVYAR
jgi:hypothetical protein